MAEIKVLNKKGKEIASGEFTGNAFIVSPAVLKKSGGAITIAHSFPIRDIVGYYSAATSKGPIQSLDWTITFNGHASLNFPIISFFNLGGENKFTFFADNLIDDFTFLARQNQEKCSYDVKWTFAVTSYAKPITLYTDTKRGAWTKAFDRARKILMPGPLPYFPKGAWEPVYCTWYAAHAALTNEFLDANAEIAAELGCKTFIVDDGWQTDEMKRVTPETLPAWYDNVGDWELSAEKLPDFKKHVEYAQSLGLKYLLWTSPYFCYPKSKFYANTPEKDRRMYSWVYSFDIGNKKICREVLARFQKVLRDYKLDGFKIDFLDYIPVDFDSPNGKHSHAFIEAFSKLIRKEAGKDALIEFRARYAVPQMLEYATQFRAGDVPFDYMLNFAQIAAIRVIVGDKVPVHADPLYWSDSEDDLTVARHMIASLSAVPMLSMELRNLKKSHKAIIANYLNFYKEHLPTFSMGHWETRFFGSIPLYLHATRGKERIVVITSGAHVSEVTAKGIKTYILNLSADPIKADIDFDAQGKEIKTGIIPCGGRGIIG